MPAEKKKKQKKKKATTKKIKKTGKIKAGAEKNNEAVIVLAGEAGQGIQSIEAILMNVFKRGGYNVFTTKEYMSRVRGGVNSTEIRVSDRPVRSFVDRIDIFIPLVPEALGRFKKRISKNTAIIGEKQKLKDERVLNVPFSHIASEFGNVIFSNTVAAGVVCGIVGADFGMLEEYIKEKFSKKGEEIIEKNTGAAKSGYTIGKELVKNNNAGVRAKKAGDLSGHILPSGTDAVAMGALAGGCDSVFAYPMTPGSGVFTKMASYSKKADIIVEQAEDEISAINMCLGAWYAGSRSMVSTSGGGFALMTEGLSLAGMLESPAVLHVAQRPGPATGLPTRTEQGDLNLVMYGGHGYFPRIILAPGNTEQAFELTREAFNMADKYQVPVIILTDQYLVDSYYNIQKFCTGKPKAEYYITKTDKNYKRYEFTKNGITPRGIPGYGSGVVCLDSDEHDETGRITEDLDNIRVKQVEQRLKKTKEIQKNTIKPVLYGAKNYKNLIIGWGSAHNSILEAMELAGLKNTAFLFCPQVYPLPKEVFAYVKRAEKIISVENNADSQFAALVKLETGRAADTDINKYSGLPFSVEELANKFRQTHK